MKIKELIKELEKYNPELEVCVDGYEDGYDSIKKNSLILKEIIISENHYDWSGIYEDYEPTEDNREDHFQALIISRDEE